MSAGCCTAIRSALVTVPLDSSLGFLLTVLAAASSAVSSALLVAVLKCLAPVAAGQ